MSRSIVSLAVWFATLATAQVPSDVSLTGPYYFRYLTVVTDGNTGIADTRTTAGTMTFSGTGGYSYTAQQLVKTAAPTAISGSGTYTVEPGGVTSLAGALFGAGGLNARLGTTALVGASTEAGPTVFDLFIAIPKAAAPLTNGSLSGSYLVSSLEFPGGGTGNIRNTNFRITANGAGGVAESAVTGQARNLGNQLATQAVSPITYLVSPDASGVLNFPLAASLTETSQLIAGSKVIYIAADGSYFIGGSLTAGSHGFVVGVKSTTAPWNGFYFNAGFRFDADRSRFTSSAASVNVTGGAAIFGRRTHQSDGVFDASILTTFAPGANGSGPLTSTPGYVNAGGGVFTTSGVGVNSSLSYELSFGTRMPPQSGSGVFIDPQRVLNGASFALGYPVAPGGFVTLFGSGLASQTATASAFPFPTSLAGVPPQSTAGVRRFTLCPPDRSVWWCPMPPPVPRLRSPFG